MSQQSQSISLLEETDRQIREKSCAEQVRRLKEARNSYHEDLVDCVRHCVWYGFCNDKPSIFFLLPVQIACASKV